jgi:SAM-dependent methyltransferase
MHFERMAEAYADSRPPYPQAIFDVLKAQGVIGPGVRVLEVGPGAGLATAELVDAGSDVVAVEPGADLADVLRRRVPSARVVVAPLEEADLGEEGTFDSVVAATSMHWVDLAVGLPKLHAALRPEGWLAVWRNVFGDDTAKTPFREEVDRIVSSRDDAVRAAHRPDDLPRMDDLAEGDWFRPVLTERWRWSTDLTSDQVRRLFRTFSDWDEAEAEAAGEAAEECGGVVTEHYQSVLHVLRRR